eukprot:TRINITY_DN44919_c0_g1_i2.p1 TRINITY_DN44919_c0_g1~~TRINITY_DN44919_c0_g1_i2.p1  ORF type:complete len:352 (-),score=23.52 TRINITY_DN44919_c0_g1_i2:140-1195(-)
MKWWAAGGVLATFLVCVRIWFANAPHDYVVEVAPAQTYQITPAKDLAGANEASIRAEYDKQAEQPWTRAIADKATALREKEALNHRTAALEKHLTSSYKVSDLSWHPSLSMDPFPYAKGERSLRDSSWTKDIAKHYKHVYSQFGEDGMLEYIFEQLPTIPKTFFEIGAHLKEANTLLLREKGWEGWCIDATTESKDLKFAAFYIRMETVGAVLNHLSVPRHLGFLSVDVDSFEYLLMRALLAHVTPELILVEYNYEWPSNERYCTPPNSYLRLLCGVCWGSSLAAMVDLLKRPEYDYHLVAVSGLPHNAFFLKGKHLTEDFIAQNSIFNHVPQPPNIPEVRVTDSVFERSR